MLTPIGKRRADGFMPTKEVGVLGIRCHHGRCGTSREDSDTGKRRDRGCMNEKTAQRGGPWNVTTHQTIRWSAFWKELRDRPKCSELLN